MTELTKEQQDETYKFVIKRGKVEEIVHRLNSLARETEGHIHSIDKEGMSVVEYSLNKEDMPRLNRELHVLKEFIQDVRVLASYFAVWIVSN